jgi:hypothetical protein
MGEHFAPYLPRVIPSLYNLIKRVFEQQNAQQVNTSDTDEAELCIQMLATIVDTNVNSFIIYIGNISTSLYECNLIVEPTLEIIVPLVKLQSSEEIRKSAASCLPKLVKATKLSSTHSAVQLTRSFIILLWQVIQNEYQPDIIQEQIFAISDCIQILNEK